jgi:hypothetical protein
VAQGVERRARHAEHAAHPGNRVGGLLRINQQTPHGYGCVRAKKARGFFQQLVLHPQPTDLVLEFFHVYALHRSRSLIGLGMLAPPRVHPVPQRAVMDIEITGDLSDRPAVSRTICTASALKCGLNRPRRSGMDASSLDRVDLSKIIGTPQTV